MLLDAEKNAEIHCGGSCMMRYTGEMLLNVDEKAGYIRLSEKQC